VLSYGVGRRKDERGRKDHRDREAGRDRLDNREAREGRKKIWASLSQNMERATDRVGGIKKEKG